MEGKNTIYQEVANDPQKAYQSAIALAEESSLDEDKARFYFIAVNAAIQYATLDQLHSLTDDILFRAKSLAEKLNFPELWGQYHSECAHILSQEGRHVEAVKEAQLYRDGVSDPSAQLSITKLMLVNAAKSGDSALFDKILEEFEKLLMISEVSKEVYIYALDGKAMALSEVSRVAEAREALLKAWEAYDKYKTDPNVRPIRHGGLTRTGLEIVLKHKILRDDPQWHFVIERVPESLTLCKDHGFKRYLDQISQMWAQWKL